MHKIEKYLLGSMILLLLKIEGLQHLELVFLSLLSLSATHLNLCIFNSEIMKESTTIILPCKHEIIKRLF